MKRKLIEAIWLTLILSLITAVAVSGTLAWSQTHERGFVAALARFWELLFGGGTLGILLFGALALPLNCSVTGACIVVSWRWPDMNNFAWFLLIWASASTVCCVIWGGIYSVYRLMGGLPFDGWDFLTVIPSIFAAVLIVVALPILRLAQHQLHLSEILK